MFDLFQTNVQFSEVFRGERNGALTRNQLNRPEQKPLRCTKNEAFHEGFGHIYWINPYWTNSFFVQCHFSEGNMIYFKNSCKIRITTWRVKCVSRKKDLDVNINFFKVNNGKGQNNVWNLFKVNSEGSRAKSITSFWWFYC